MVVSNNFYVHPDPWGFMIQFDEHISDFIQRFSLIKSIKALQGCSGHVATNPGRATCGTNGQAVDPQNFKSVFRGDVALPRDSLSPVSVFFF